VIWKLVDRLREWQEARTLDPAHALGRRGENAAHRFLRANGYWVVDRNWRTFRGQHELDIVARPKNEPERLVVVEVKSRRTETEAGPARNVDREKRQSLRAAAYVYCKWCGVEPAQVRFDVISIVFEPRMRVEHDRDAFSFREENG